MTDVSESMSTGSEPEPVPADKDDIRELRAQLDAITQELKRLNERVRTVDQRTMMMPRGLLTDIQALQQLLQRYEPRATLPQVAGWALSPRGLLTLTDLIESTDARTVVECGSGTSTLWIALALRKLGRGKVIALDHLPEYAERTQALIDAHDLGWFAEVRLAPLAERATPRGSFLWYDVDPVTFRHPIDVLLVDGPPQSTGRHARYPALPVLTPYLATDTMIICDDTSRRDEQEMIDFWIEEDPRLQRLPSPGQDLELLRLSS
ncbi:class I SAM-dependent methyltransferase [Microbacterium jejuense]|uniref:O-methyltransferase n=1 Tax=Microbacterium jejuense TaxID=1263637 RepID=UPI0031ECA851